MSAPEVQVPDATKSIGDVSEKLQSSLYAWALRHVAVNELVSIEFVPASQTIRVVNGELLTMTAEQMIFWGHAVAQSGDRDNELADDVAWREPVAEGFAKAHGDYWKSRSHPKILEIKDGEGPFRRKEYNQVLHRLRSADAERMISPFGQGFVDSVAEGAITLEPDQEQVARVDEFLAVRRPELHQKIHQEPELGRRS